VGAAHRRTHRRETTACACARVRAHLRARSVPHAPVLGVRARRRYACRVNACGVRRRELRLEGPGRGSAVRALRAIVAHRRARTRTRAHKSEVRTRYPRAPLPSVPHTCAHAHSRARAHKCTRARIGSASSQGNLTMAFSAGHYGECGCGGYYAYSQTLSDVAWRCSWIHRNIGAFGGDVGRVTIAGMCVI
jgi:hypothetical protein